MQQPAICQDIFANLYSLINSFTTLQQAPNTSFSHMGGFQSLAQQPQASATMVDDSVEQMVQWLVMAALVFFLLLGQQQPRMQQNLKPHQQNQNGNQGGPGGIY